MDRLFATNKSKRLWNTIKKTGSSNFSNNAVSNVELTEHFSNKFSSDTAFTDQMLQAHRVVKEKYEHLCKNAYNISESKIKRYMKCLKYGTAAGHDGITTEHLRFTPFISQSFANCVSTVW